jgi:hypothetical protein
MYVIILNITRTDQWGGELEEVLAYGNCFVLEFEFIYALQIQVEDDTIGYGTSQVQTRNTTVMLLEKFIRL